MKRAWSVAILLGVLTGACGDDGGDDGPCAAAAGAYLVEFGPGTGTCTGLDLDELAALVGAVEVSEDAACESTVEASGADDGSCALTVAVDGKVDADGLVDGHAEVESNCPPNDGGCSHSFQVTFELLHEPNVRERPSSH